MRKDVCYLIDKDMNLYIIKEKTILKLFDKKEISPLDILSQVDNDNLEELFTELKFNFKESEENEEESIPLFW